ncbi:MAG: LacI family DNA-binding transcriptional regulator, partial [Planctomycetota bacterium]
AGHDIQVTVSQLPDMSLATPATMPKILRERSADGLLINFTHHVPEALPALIDKHRIPAVWLNTRQGKHCVYADEFDAYDRATQHLLELGHTQIAFYISSEAGHFSEADRAAGYTQAMHRVGLNERVHKAGAAEHPDPLDDDRLERAITFLKHPDRPTGLLAYSHTDSIILATAAATLGLRLGHDLSLIGLGEEPRSPLGVSLTQVVVQQEELGRAGVRRLLRLIETPTAESPDRLIAAELCVGLSTGPVASRT